MFSIFKKLPCQFHIGKNIHYDCIAWQSSWQWHAVQFSGLEQVLSTNQISTLVTYGRSVLSWSPMSVHPSVHKSTISHAVIQFCNISRRCHISANPTEYGWATTILAYPAELKFGIIFWSWAGRQCHKHYTAQYIMCLLHAWKCDWP